MAALLTEYAGLAYSLDLRDKALQLYQHALGLDPCQLSALNALVQYQLLSRTALQSLVEHVSQSIPVPFRPILHLQCKKELCPTPGPSSHQQVSV